MIEKMRPGTLGPKKEAYNIWNHCGFESRAELGADHRADPRVYLHADLRAERRFRSRLT